MCVHVRVQSFFCDIIGCINVLLYYVHMYSYYCRICHIFYMYTFSLFHCTCTHVYLYFVSFRASGGHPHPPPAGEGAPSWRDETPSNDQWRDGTISTDYNHGLAL